MTMFREINAAIKREFGSRPGFVAAKSDMVGSFPVVRFEGDLPVSLADAIGRFVEQQYPAFTRPHDRPSQRILGFINGGTVINWLSR